MMMILLMWFQSSLPEHMCIEQLNRSRAFQIQMQTEHRDSDEIVVQCSPRYLRERSGELRVGVARCEMF